MKKVYFFWIIVLFFCKNSLAQTKTNSIIFTDVVVGYAVGSSEGLTLGLNLNYQRKNDLLTARYIVVSKFQHDPNAFILPVFRPLEQLNELGLLYGKRYIYNGHSLSYSAGIAYVNREVMTYDNANNSSSYNQQNIGIPFEININWFNAKKERFRIIYGLIPVGKPTSFSRSIGFKFYGNVSKTTFIGLGLNYGFGWHKNY